MGKFFYGDLTRDDATHIMAGIHAAEVQGPSGQVRRSRLAPNLRGVFVRMGPGPHWELDPTGAKRNGRAGFERSVWRMRMRHWAMPLRVEFERERVKAMEARKNERGAGGGGESGSGKGGGGGGREGGKGTVQGCGNGGNCKQVAFRSKNCSSNSSDGW